MRMMQRRFSHRVMKGRRAFLAAKRRSVPLKALIPNIVTLLGLCAGLTAIRLAVESRYDMALVAIGVAAVLDGVDGRMARLLKASSRFGAELDSLADFVSFGVAPAIVVYLWGFTSVRSLGWIVVLVFALAAALRLARFNVALDAPARPLWQSAFFVGMPVPAGAIVVMLPLYLEGLGLPTAFIKVPPLLAVYAVLIAFLMVSRLRTFSGKLIGRRVSRDYVAPVIALAALTAAVLATYPYLTLTVGCLIYLALIPVSIRRYREMEQASAAETEAPALEHERESLNSDSDPA